MTENAPSGRKITQSVQFKFVAAFFVLIAALLGLLNTYPLIASRDLVFKEKESALLGQAAVISSSLEALDSLTENSVAQVMELLDVTGLDRIIITGPGGLTLYDTAESSAVGKYAMLSETSLALSGKQVFRSNYSGGAFISRACLPVSTGDLVLGSVYLCEYDTEQASLLNGIQTRLRAISVIACLAALTLTVIFSRALTGRITRLVEAIRVVRGGDYDYLMETSGNDELTELSEEFNNLTQRLRATEEQRRRFVSDASHELKTPLASIRLLSDSIVQNADMDTATMREFVTDIGSEADRLQRTTEKLLDLSRRDDGASGERRPVDTAEIARGTLRLLTPLAESRGVTIDTSLEEGCMILASGDDVYQIIFNLAENAIKYNVEGGSVSIGIRGEGESVLLTVDDTGIGIPEEDREHVFSRFYRVDKARSRASGGSGLGLSIVHDAVLTLGGTIELSPRSPQGTSFAVIFPAWKGAEE